MSDRKVQRAGAGSQQFQISGDLILGVTEDRSKQIAEEAARRLLGEIGDELQDKLNRRLAEMLNAAASHNDCSVQDILEGVKARPYTHDLFGEAVNAARRSPVINSRNTIGEIVARMSRSGPDYTFRNLDPDQFVTRALSDLEGQHVRLLLQLGRASPPLDFLRAGVDVDRLCLVMFYTNTLATATLGTLERHRLVRHVKDYSRLTRAVRPNGKWRVSDFGGMVLDRLNLSKCGGFVYEDAATRLVIENVPAGALAEDDLALTSVLGKRRARRIIKETRNETGTA